MVKKTKKKVTKKKTTSKKIKPKKRTPVGIQRVIPKKKDPKMGKRGRASRNKGKRGEREVAKLLTLRGYPARRGVQYKGGLNSPDVICEPLNFVHIEAKWVNKLNLYTAFEQAKSEAGMEKVPVVIQKADRKEVLVTMSYFDWINLIQCALGDKDSLNTLKRLIDEQRGINGNGTENREQCSSSGLTNHEAEEGESDSSLL